MAQKTKKKQFSVLFFLLGTMLALWVAIFCIFLLWGFITSVKSPAEFRKNVIWLPKTWKFSNFVYIFKNFRCQVYDEFGNLYAVGVVEQAIYSIIYAVGGAFIGALVPCLVAYVTSKFPCWMSAVISTIVIATMSLTVVGSYPSTLWLLKRIGLYDSLVGILIMKASFLGMNYLLFFSAFKGVNKTYFEAAMLDGCSEFKQMVHIGIPLVTTMFSSIFLLQFIALWNDYQTPLLYAPTYPTLAYGIYSMSVSGYIGLTAPPMRIGSSVYLIVPMLIIFLLLKDKLMRNVSVGGVKE